MSIYKGTQLISGVATPVQGARNIGQIIQSTIPLTDAGLHLLDGALIDGNGIYSAFVDYIASIYDASASYFTTEASWQDSVTNYGVCGKFVYDSVNNTVRLPKYSSKIFTQDIINKSASVFGTGQALGLMGSDGITATGKKCALYGTDITGPEFALSIADSYGQVVGIGASQTSVFNDTTIGVTNDPNNSGLMSLVSITSSLDGYYYIVVATSTKTDIEVDIDEIATDLNGKANVDLSNTNNQAKILMSGMGMPSSRYMGLALGASGATYTAPANGWVYLFGEQTGLSGYIFIKNFANGLETVCQPPNVSTFAIRGYIPVAKGQIYNITYGDVTIHLHAFIYSTGSESEA